LDIPFEGDFEDFQQMMLTINMRADARISITPKPTLTMAPSRLAWPSTASISCAIPIYAKDIAIIDIHVETIRRSPVQFTMAKGAVLAKRTELKHKESVASNFVCLSN
jgi:hypothetical protein